MERKCGLSHGYFSHIRRSISKNVRTTIAQQFPDLNVDWLITGEGEMLISPNNKISETERSRYIEMISSRQERILFLERKLLELQCEMDSLRDTTTK
jgi:hypothetical protein